MDYETYARELATLPKELAFSEQEYRQRVVDVRKEMSKAGLDALLITFHPHLCYFAGYTTFATDKYTCLLIPLTGELVLQVPAIDIPAAIVPGWLPTKNIIAYHWHDPKSAVDQITSIMRERGLNAGRIGLEFNRACFAHQFYLDLVERLPRARFENIPASVFKGRLTKSPAEIKYLRKAAEITAIGLNASLEVIAGGKTENEVAGAAYGAMIAAGGEYFSSQPILAGGWRSGSAHAIYKRGALKSGDIIFMEYGGCYERYTCPMARTAVIGRPSSAVQRVADASKKILELVLSKAKGGIAVRELAVAANNLYRGTEDALFTGNHGYSVGLGFPPTWNEGLFYINEDNKDVFESGMVLHVNHFLRIPAKFGIALSETILITENGCDVLTDVPNRPAQDLHIKPEGRSAAA